VGTTTIDEALAGMDEIIARARADGDRRGYFAVLYRKVTAKVKEGVEAGFFDDAERMVRLDCLFADRYLDAVAAADAGGTPTRSWALTFDAAESVAAADPAAPAGRHQRAHQPRPRDRGGPLLPGR
jgi:hypothetical protein